MCSLSTVPALRMMESDPRSGLRKIYRTVNMFLRPPDYSCVHQAILTKLNYMKGLFYPDVGGVMVGFTKVKVDRSTRDPEQGAMFHMVKLGAEFYVFKPVAGNELQCEVVGMEGGEMKYRTLGHYDVKVASSQSDDYVWPGQQVMIKVEGVEHTTPDQPPFIEGRVVDEAAEGGGPLIEDVDVLEVSGGIESGTCDMENLKRNKGDKSNNSRNNGEAGRKRKITVEEGGEMDKYEVKPKKKMYNMRRSNVDEVTSTGSPNNSPVAAEGLVEVSTQLSPKKKSPPGLKCSPIKKLPSILSSPIKKLPTSIPSLANSTSFNLGTFQPLLSDRESTNQAATDPVIASDDKKIGQAKKSSIKRSRKFELPPGFTKKMRPNSNNKVDHYLNPCGAKLRNQREVLEWVENHPSYMVKVGQDTTEVVDASSNRDMSGLSQHDPDGIVGNQSAQPEDTEYESQSLLEYENKKTKAKITPNTNWPKNPKRNLNTPVNIDQVKLNETEVANKILVKTSVKSQLKFPGVLTARESYADSGCQADKNSSKESESDGDSSAEEQSHLSPVRPEQLPNTSIESESDSSDDEDTSRTKNITNLNKSNLQGAVKYSSSDSDSASDESLFVSGDKKDKDATNVKPVPDSSNIIKVTKPTVATNPQVQVKTSDQPLKPLATYSNSDSSDDSDKSSDDETKANEPDKKPVAPSLANVNFSSNSPIQALLKSSVEGAASTFALALASNQELNNNKKRKEPIGAGAQSTSSHVKTKKNTPPRKEPIGAQAKSPNVEIQKIAPPQLSSTLMPLILKSKSKLAALKAPDGISPILKTRHENKSGSSSRIATHFFDTVMIYDINEE